MAMAHDTFRNNKHCWQVYFDANTLFKTFPRAGVSAPDNINVVHARMV
jgi:hypothetical protein